MLLTRRTLVSTGTAATLVGISGIGRGAPPTSAQELGPFYPVSHLADVDADLTRVLGRTGVAKGTPINVLGRVIDTKGNPVSNARLEIWQANAAGRYLHPGDTKIRRRSTLISKGLRRFARTAMASSSSGQSNRALTLLAATGSGLRTFTWK